MTCGWFAVDTAKIYVSNIDALCIRQVEYFYAVCRFAEPAPELTALVLYSWSFELRECTVNNQVAIGLPCFFDSVCRLRQSIQVARDDLFAN